MYGTIDSETGRPVLVYEMSPQAKMQPEFVFSATGPIYYSKNSHKRTNKRKKR